MLPAWKKIKTISGTHFFRADRTSSSSPTPVGSYWLVWTIEDPNLKDEVLSKNEDELFSSTIMDEVGSAGNLPKDFVENQDDFTVYRLIAPPIS